MVELPKKSPFSRKFSILCRGGVTQFVHLYKSRGNSNWFVACKSGRCELRYAKKKKAQTLVESEDLCQHLETFKNFYIENIHGQEEQHMELAEGGLPHSTDELNNASSGTVKNPKSDGLDQTKVIYIFFLGQHGYFIFHEATAIFIAREAQCR